MKKKRSLNAIMNLVRMRVEQKYQPDPSGPINQPREYPYLELVYDSEVIVSLGKKFFRMTYSIDDQDAVTLGEAEEVEKTFKPTGKCLWEAGEDYQDCILVNPDEDVRQPIFEIKAVTDDPDDEMVLDVLAAPFYGPKDGKDLQGEYFSPKTKFYLEAFKSPLIVYYHGFDANKKRMWMPEIVGKTKKVWQDAKGVWVRVVLEKGKSLSEKIWNAAKKGLAVASSGTVSHLKRLAKDGEILSWPLAEVSIWDGDKHRPQANAYAVAMPVMKAHFELAGMGFPELPDAEDDAKGEGNSQSAPQGMKDGADTKNQTKKSSKTEEEMTPEEILALIKKAIAENDSAKAEALKAQLAEQEKIDAAIKANDEKWEKKIAEGQRLSFNGQAPYQAKFADTWKFDNYSPAEMALTIDVLKSANKSASPALLKSLALKCVTMQGSEEASYIKGAMKASGLEPTEEAVKAATDPAYTGLSSYGAEWIGTAYAMQIWEKIRAARQVVPRIPTVVIPDGYSSEYFPLEGTDPTWYKVAEVTAADSTMKVPAATITNSQMGTGQKQITVGKAGARAMYSGELTEDSLLPYTSQLQVQLYESGGEMLEHMVIDGDTETTGSTNINDIGNGSTQTATNLHLVMDGFRKLALVTNTANSRSASGGLTVDDFIETLWLLGTAGMAVADPTKCAFIVDPNVWKAASKLAEVLTKDVYSAATLENGWLKQMGGVGVIPSWFMHYKSTTNPRKANTAGKVDQTSQANNTTGAILAVRFDQWKLGYKRRLTMETTRIANADTWEIVAMMRVGLAYRDTEAAAISYNVGV